MAREFGDLPCATCGRPIKSPFCTYICAACLDALLEPENDDDDVPFDEKYYEEEVLP